MNINHILLVAIFILAFVGYCQYQNEPFVSNVKNKKKKINKKKNKSRNSVPNVDNISQFSIESSTSQNGKVAPVNLGDESLYDENISKSDGTNMMTSLSFFENSDDSESIEY